MPQGSTTADRPRPAVSQRQLAANRRNALKSTGPKTPEGKAKVSKNAMKHGLLTREIIVPGEDVTELDEFREALVAQLAPEGELEGLFADRVVQAAWRLRRAARIEREMMEADYGEGPQFGPKSSETHKTLGRVVAQDMAQQNTYGKLRRYEGHIERGLYKALHELQRLQAARLGEGPPVPVAVDVNVSGAEGILS